MVNWYDIAHKVLMNEKWKKKNLVDNLEFVNDHE